LRSLHCQSSRSTPELGSCWSGSTTTTTRLKRAQAIHRQSSEVPEAKPRRDLEWELEGKLLPLSPSLCFCFRFAAAKKATTTNLSLPSILVLLQQRIFFLL
jgi:hypothetical protein